MVHTSPIGLVPKQHRKDRFRMIVDLSSPSGQSVNDGVKYASVDQAVSIIQHLGRGTQLVKVDINDAYRIIPVHPSDYHPGRGKRS